VVLIIEDDEDTSAVYGDFLELVGFRVTIAATGAEALEAMGAHPIAAVLLDLSLPDADGRDLCEHLRAAVAPRALPVMALTGHNLDEADRAKFEGVIRKPIDLDLVVAWLRRVLPASAPRS
jgi:two-component system OmpR family response regulator